MSKKSKCYFCQANANPCYKSPEILKSFLRQDKLLQARKESGCCPTHQRFLAREVKRAKTIALL